LIVSTFYFLFYFGAVPTVCFFLFFVFCSSIYWCIIWAVEAVNRVTTSNCRCWLFHSCVYN